MAEAETGKMQLRATEHHEAPATTRSWEGVGRMLSRASETTWLPDIPIPNISWRENTSGLFQSSECGCSCSPSECAPPAPQAQGPE